MCHGGWALWVWASVGLSLSPLQSPHLHSAPCLGETGLCGGPGSAQWLLEAEGLEAEWGLGALALLAVPLSSLCREMALWVLGPEALS